MKLNKQELLVYAVLWLILFMAPVLSGYMRAAQSDVLVFQWADIIGVWRQYALLFAVFLLHNFFLAPLLIERQRRMLYFSLVAVLLAAFMVVQCTNRPADSRPRGEMAQHDGSGPPAPPEGRPMDGGPRHRPDGPRPDGVRPERPPQDEPPRLEPRGDGERPPVLMGQQDLVATVILILMLGMNIGVKLYFRQRDDRRRLFLLERQNMEQQLEYLRYQINPHFLMNTLNNIHALIDIDAERAKESIIGLSKIMRFVLYEGSKQTVPLSRELAFTEDYIQLMRMRVTDRVSITVDMPDRVPDSQIPPLVLITFVENAFKHGVSYRQASFIEVKVSTDADRLTFTCRNSRVPQGEDHHGGVGLDNVRRRLDLLYADRYTLNIRPQDDTYSVELSLPLTPHPSPLTLHPSPPND